MTYAGIHLRLSSALRATLALYWQKLSHKTIPYSPIKIAPATVLVSPLATLAARLLGGRERRRRGRIVCGRDLDRATARLARRVIALLAGAATEALLTNQRLLELVGGRSRGDWALVLEAMQHDRDGLDLTSLAPSWSEHAGMRSARWPRR